MNYFVWKHKMHNIGKVIYAKDANQAKEILAEEVDDNEELDNYYLDYQYWKEEWAWVKFSWDNS